MSGTESPWTDEDVEAAKQMVYRIPGPAADGDDWGADVRAILDWAWASPRVAELQRAAKVEALAPVRALESHWRRHLNANRCPSCQQADGMCDHEEGYNHALAFLTEAIKQAAS